MIRHHVRRRTGVRNIESHALVLLVRSGAELGRWPLVGPWRPDLGMVDDLARSQLAVRRLGCTLLLGYARPELRALLELVGLRTTIPCVDLSTLDLSAPLDLSALDLSALHLPPPDLPRSDLVAPADPADPTRWRASTLRRCTSIRPPEPTDPPSPRR